MTRIAPLIGAIWLCGAAPALAATLSVGPGQKYAQPSAAIAAASPGDTVAISPGTYYDCATVHADRLTIEGTGPGVVLTDRTCAGKAILITAARGITVRNLTLQRARVPDRNGAGIRAEGPDLTVDGVSFVNDEDGLLAADQPASEIRIRNSVFVQDGTCGERCSAALTVDRVRLLHVEATRFGDLRGNRAIVSAAGRTELIGDTIADGADGATGALVDLPAGGDLLVQGCRFEKGANSVSPHAGILLHGPAGGTQVVAHNSFAADGGAGILVLNWGDGAPAVSDNTLAAGVAALSSSGALWNRVHGQLYDAKMMLEKAVGLAKRAVRKVM